MGSSCEVRPSYGAPGAGGGESRVGACATGLSATAAVRSRICLGTMTFGAETDEAGSHAQLDRFVESGGNLVDPDVHAPARQRSSVAALASRPADVTAPVVLATKGRFPMGTDPNSRASRPGISPAPWTTPETAGRRVGRSLPSARLGPSHPADRDAARHGRLRRAGKIRTTGTVELHRLAAHQGRAPARALGLAEPVTLQPQYSLIVREIEWEIVPAALDAR